MSHIPLISSAFDERCARAGSRVAIREGGHDLTFKDLLRQSESISRTLEMCVQERGQRVAILLPNSAAFVASFFGIVRLGAVAAPLSIAYRTQELEYYLNDLEPAAVIADAGLIGLLETVAPRLTSAPAFLPATAAKGPPLVGLGSGGAPPIHSADSPPLLQLYTSGSVGTPKRVVRTHASLLAEVKALERVFAIDERDR